METENLSLLFQKRKIPSTPMPTKSEKIKNALTNFVYSQSNIGFLASLFCATVVLISLWDSEKRTAAIIWYNFFLLVILFRTTISILYSISKDKETPENLWRNLFILGSGLGGLGWGLAGSILYPENINQQILIVLVLAGITAGAVPILSGILEAAVAFLLLSLLPFTFNLIYQQTNPLFIVTVVVYSVYLITLAYDSNKSIRSFIALQFQNNALMTNLSEAKNQLELINKKLEQISTHDLLTHIPNRNLFMNHFIESLERAKANKKILALTYIDLDNFRKINESYGQHVGDQLLLIIVDRLENFTNSKEKLSRLAGDTFTMLIEDASEPNEIAKIVSNVCQTINQPVIIQDIEIHITASVGIGVYPIDGTEPENLLDVAKNAMCYVKKHRGNNFRFNVTLLTK